MGLFKQLKEYKSNPDAERAYYAEHLGPHLAPGEPLIGAVTGNNMVRKARGLFLIGVTTQRLILVPLDRRGQPTADVRSVGRSDITGSSIWGWGGSVRDFLSTQADQEIRFTTAADEYRFMIIGGNWLENMFTSDTSRGSLDTLVDFLQSTKPT